MKKIINIFLATLVLLSLFACNKDTFVKNKKQFKVVKTDTDLHYYGGTAMVELNAAVAEVETTADWVHYSIVRNKVDLTFDKNPTYDSRTATVRFKCKKGHSQEVSFTQLGIVSIVEPPKKESIPAKGGSFEFLYDSKEEYTVTGLEDIDWVSYKLMDSKMIFTVLPLTTTGKREVNVTIKVGLLIEHTITIEQEKKQAKSFFAGEYTLSYLDPRTANMVSLDVLLTDNTADDTFTLSSDDLTYTLKLAFNEDTASLSLIVQNSVSNVGNIPVLWAAAFIPPGSDRYDFKDSGNYGVVAKWNDTSKKFAFLSAPNEEGITIDGFALFSILNSRLVNTRHNVMLNISMTKK